MRFKANKSNLWKTSSECTLKTNKLDEDKSVDLVIIGGGYTGVSCALTLAEKGLKVALLEAESIGYGVSGRSVGLVNSGLWMEPEKVESIMGAVAGKKLNQLLAQAPELVFSNITQYDIDCELTQTGTLHCAHSKSGLENLKNRLRQYQAIGTKVDLLSQEEVTNKMGSSAYYGALHFNEAGTIQPLAYVRGLARAAITAGVSIHQDTRVTAIERKNNAWEITTPSFQLKSDAVVLATNAYHKNISRCSPPSFTPVNYFQTATKPLSRELLNKILPERQGCWDTAMIMSSVRRDQAGRLIIGSIGSLDSSTCAIHTHWAQDKLKKLFPYLGALEFEYAWQGRIAYSNDHLHHIVEFGPNAISLFGYSGRGIGPGTIFGRAAADYILSGDISHLPVMPVSFYTEKHTQLKATFYELGAAAVHGTTSLFNL